MSEPTPRPSCELKLRWCPACGGKAPTQGVCATCEGTGIDLADFRIELDKVNWDGDE